MDRPVLHAFVRELAEHERLAEFVEALPARARVSEAALPVVLASLYERLGRPLVCLLPEDDPEGLVRAAADAVETLDAEGLEAAQRAINGKRS